MRTRRAKRSRARDLGTMQSGERGEARGEPNENVDGFTQYETVESPWRARVESVCSIASETRLLLGLSESPSRARVESV